MEGEINMIEKFMILEGFYDCYAISNLGRVKNIRNGFILKNTVGQDGYLSVLLSKNGKKRRVRVHVLVGNAFLEKVQGKDFLNHIDGNKENPKLENLEWCTHGENMQHAYDTNLIPSKYSGKNIVAYNLNDEFVGMYSSVKECASILGLHESPIYRVLKGKRTFHKGYKFSYVDRIEYGLDEKTTSPYRITTSVDCPNK
jgi:hypothetical protein